MKWTRLGVLVFIILLLLASINALGSEYNNGARISLGHSVANSELPLGEIGYEYNNWEIAATLMGEGRTKNGDQDLVGIYSLSRMVRPSWNFLGATNYYRLGVSYVNDSPLVGEANFRLGIGLEWDIVQLEYFHYSSAGINSTNSGIDGILLRYKISM